MKHEQAWDKLPDLLQDRDQHDLVAHVAGCQHCQRQLFLLGRVDRLLRASAPAHQLRRDKRRQLLRWLARPTGIAAAAIVIAAAAIVTLVVLPLPNGGASHEFALHTAAGKRVGQATLTHADGDNMSLSLVAKGLPHPPGGIYQLWAGSNRSTTVLVGRFMVDAHGSCRARFNLPRTSSSARFWITPPRNPAAIVATT